MNIGNLIKEYRTKHKMTMQEFADKAGLSKGYISMLEKGVHPQNGKEIVPSIDTVEKIAKALGITIDELLEKTDPKQKIKVSGNNANQDQGWYLDPEVAEKAQEIYEDPDIGGLEL